jgi:hypothetical protein
LPSPSGVKKWIADRPIYFSSLMLKSHRPNDFASSINKGKEATQLF